MSDLNKPSINADSQMPKETKYKIIIGVVLLLALIGLGIAALRKVPEIDAPIKVEQELPEDVVIEKDKMKIAKSSWKDGAWCAVEKDSVTAIHIVDNYEGSAETVWLVDELIFAQNDTGDIYISVGAGLRMRGSMRYAFANFPNATAISGLHLLETSQVTDMSYIFAGSNFEEIDISSWDTSSVVNFSHMLDKTQQTKVVNMNNLNLTNVVDISYMFANCVSLTDIYIENVDTSHIRNMEGLFQSLGDSTIECKARVHGSLDTSSCTNMSFMFKHSKIDNLSELVQGFDTSKVTTMEGMFAEGLNMLELDLSGWDVSNVTNMTEMFVDIVFLKDLNMEGWQPTKLKYADRMFFNCYNLRYFNQWGPAPNIQSAESMFENCFELQDIDITCFDGTTIQNADRMFYCLQYIKHFYSNGFTVVNPAPEMFLWCLAIEGPTPYNEKQVSQAMATTSGYLTPTKEAGVG